MRKFFPALLIIAFAHHAYSQDTTAALKDTSWKKGGFISLMFNQVAFSHWAGGGTNSFSFTGIGNGFVKYTKGKNYWNSFLITQYGLTQTQYDHKATKNIDLLELQTKAGHGIGHNFNLAALVDFLSQFTNGYNYPNDSLIVSKFLAPAYLTISLGVEWKPVDYFSVMLSPVTGKLTFVNDQEIADQVLNGASLYGTEPAVYDSDGVLLSHGENLRKELGAYLTAQFKKDIFKNVNLATRLQLFDNYTDKNESNRKNIDVNYDLLINMKVNKWLAASFFLTIIYDNDITIADLDEDGIPTGAAGPRTQVKEGIGIGITYNIGDEMK